MEGSRGVRAPALIVLLILLASGSIEAGYRFEGGVRLGPADALEQWARALPGIHEQHALIDTCLADRSACAPWLVGVRVLVERARGLDRERQLRLVNRYVNGRGYRRERGRARPAADATAALAVANHWATLQELMREGGDCEDYALGKYQLLRALGVRARDLRIVVVYLRGRREYHAMLAVRRGRRDAWLLDIDNNVYRSRPAGYRFVFAMNERSIWDHRLAPGGGSPG